MHGDQKSSTVDLMHGAMQKNDSGRCHAWFNAWRHAHHAWCHAWHNAWRHAWAGKKTGLTQPRGDAQLERPHTCFRVLLRAVPNFSPQYQIILPSTKLSSTVPKYPLQYQNIPSSTKIQNVVLDLYFWYCRLCCIGMSLV